MDYSPEAVNELAGYIALAAAIPATVVTSIYGFGSPWYRSWLGRTIFAQWLSIVLVFAVILTRRFFGTYLGYEWVAVVTYSLLFVTFTAITVVVILERRAPARPLVSTKGRKHMSNLTPGPDHAAAPTFFEQTRKAFVAGGVAAVAAAGASFATAAGDGDLTAAEGWVIASFAVGGFAAAFAATWRVPNAQV